MTSIRIINPPIHTISFFGVDQAVYLDVDSDFNLRLSKAIEEITEVGEISQSASISNSIPVTHRNNACLEQFEANVFIRSVDYLEVEVRFDGDILPLHKLTVVNWRDREGRIEIELFGTGWVTDLENILLRSLDLGTFEYTLENVNETWSNTTAFACPALAHYGGWNDEGKSGRKDLRFWFNLTQLMNKAFCKIGWSFRSPFFQNSIGAQFYGYLSDKRWFSYRDKDDQFRVIVGETVARTITGNPQNLLLDKISDPFNLYNNLLRPLEYIYPPTAPPGDLKILVNDFTVELQAANSFDVQPTFVFSVYRNRGGDFEFMFVDTYKGDVFNPFVKKFNWEITIEAVEPGDSFGVVITYGDIYLEGAGDYTNWKLITANLVFAPDRYYYTPDDTIYLADLIDPNVNGLQLFKSLTHLINGKIDTRYDTREVWLHIPYVTTIQGNVVQGFFQRGNEILDLSDKVVPQSRVVETVDQRRNRYVELKFKNTTDEYIKSKTEREPFSRIVDLGSGKGETTTIENELFEPTMEVKTTITEIGSGIDSGKQTPYLPALWDNTEGRISSEIGFRIGYNYGLINQLNTDGLNYQINFEGNIRNTFGYISQIPLRPRRDGSSNPPTIHIAFAEYADDFYRLFYKQWINEKSKPLNFNFLLYLTYQDYLNLDFRKPVGWFYNDTFLIYQLLSVKDFNLEVRTATPVDVKLLEC